MEFSVRIEEEIIPKIKQIYNKSINNEYSERMVDICTTNELRVNNTVCNHKIKHKYTLENTRGNKKIVDRLYGHNYGSLYAEFVRSLTLPKVERGR